MRARTRIKIKPGIPIFVNILNHSFLINLDKLRTAHRHHNFRQYQYSNNALAPQLSSNFKQRTNTTTLQLNEEKDSLFLLALYKLGIFLIPPNANLKGFGKLETDHLGTGNGYYFIQNTRIEQSILFQFVTLPK